MRFLGKLVGLALVLAGIYFLGQNILFTTRISPYWWQDLSASGSVLAILAGIVTALYGDRSIRNAGWLLIALGILLVFVSGRVILQPTSLWTFFLSFVSLMAGFQLITTGRLRL